MCDIRCKFCGKECKNQLSRARHERSCKLNPNYDENITAFKKGGRNSCIKQNKIRKKERIEYKCKCEKCGKEYIIVCTETDFLKKKHFFCSRSCANSRNHSEETKLKIRISINNYCESHPSKRIENKYFCKKCGRKLSKKTKTGYCKKCVQSTDAMRLKSHYAGLKSVAIQKQTRRSKNEIAFCELCKSYFKEVRNNEPIFNGWDADIIIDDVKIAVLWNGLWHYQKITSKHSVEAVQNRDRIKIKEIQKCGYIPYIIKDIGKYNIKKVNNEFKNFIIFVKSIENV